MSLLESFQQGQFSRAIAEYESINKEISASRLFLLEDNTNSSKLLPFPDANTPRFNLGVNLKTGSLEAETKELLGLCS